MKRIKVLVCLLLSLCMTGCWDMHEPENNTFIIILGVDIADDDNVIVTIAFPLTQGSVDGAKPGEGGEGDKYELMSVKAPTILEGLHWFTAALSSPLALYTIKTVVVSEALARSDKLRGVFSIWRTEQMRNTASVLISSGTAREFVEARIKETAIDPLRQEELLLEQANGSAYSTAVQFLDLIINMQMGGEDGVAMYGGVASETGGEGGGQEIPNDKDSKEGYLPGEIPLQGISKTQICGLAVFADDKMVGVLDSGEAQLFAMLMNSKTRMLLTLQDPLRPENALVASITSSKATRVDCNIDQDGARFNLTVHLRCSLESIESKDVYADMENLSLLEKYIRKECEQKLAALMYKVQKEYQADILRLGGKAKRCFATIEDWDHFNWPERYRDALVEVHVNLDIEQTGILTP